MPVDGKTFLEAIRPALETGDAQRVAQCVSKRWDVYELCSLLADPNTDARRVAAVVLGLVGDESVIGCLGKSLHDIDEQVNHMAVHSLWSIWFRNVDPIAAGPFNEGLAMLSAEAYQRAIECFHEATQIVPTFAEAYNQSAIAYFFLGEWKASIAECKRAIQHMPLHFGAACGMGHCYTELGDLRRSLDCYRHALKVNPRMPAITSLCECIEEKMRKQNDSSGMYSFDRASV